MDSQALPHPPGAIFDRLAGLAVAARKRHEICGVGYAPQFNRGQAIQI